MSSQKSGDQKAGKNRNAMSKIKMGRQDLFQFGVKCKTNKTNNNKSSKEYEAKAEPKQKSDFLQYDLKISETSEVNV